MFPLFVLLLYLLLLDLRLSLLTALCWETQECSSYRDVFLLNFHSSDLPCAKGYNSLWEMLPDCIEQLIVESENLMSKQKKELRKKYEKLKTAQPLLLDAAKAADPLAPYMVRLGAFDLGSICDDPAGGGEEVAEQPDPPLPNWVTRAVAPDVPPKDRRELLKTAVRSFERTVEQLRTVVLEVSAKSAAIHDLITIRDDSDGCQSLTSALTEHLQKVFKETDPSMGICVVADKPVVLSAQASVTGRITHLAKQLAKLRGKNRQKDHRRVVFCGQWYEDCPRTTARRTQGGGKFGGGGGGDGGGGSGGGGGGSGVAMGDVAAAGAPERARQAFLQAWVRVDRGMNRQKLGLSTPRELDRPRILPTSRGEGRHFYYVFNENSSRACPVCSAGSLTAQERAIHQFHIPTSRDREREREDKIFKRGRGLAVFWMRVMWLR